MKREIHRNLDRMKKMRDENRRTIFHFYTPTPIVFYIVVQSRGCVLLNIYTGKQIDT